MCSIFLSVLLCTVAAPSVAQPAALQKAQTTMCPAPGTREARWIGLPLLRGGKGYVATPMGQVHYRRAGPEDGTVIVLLHQTPWSMVQFAEVQACLDGLGIASLAIDTPGYGMSDPPAGPPAIEQYSDNLVAVLDALGIERAVMAGHHTGAAIAASFAARHPDRTAGVLLHGVPLYTEQERAVRLHTPERSRELSEDGHHLSDYYTYIRRYAGPHPRGAVTANWSTILWYLAGDADVAHEAVFRHDLGADLERLSAPALILSDAGDTLHPNDVRAASLYANFKLVTFSEGGAHSLMLDPARWAGIAADFVRGIRFSARSGDATDGSQAADGAGKAAERSRLAFEISAISTEAAR